ncbi:sp110 nuclear body protein isoform X1 [Pteropus medius]|uniref:sp110 nuclear body protein isoform X1 n=1 Tax=Pteropus vampyrus TaxID=132908 RepID=UPI00196B0BEE|nr:sp110 nuclear body protein isoform X1 [Pteropus giganteus]XP_039711942.1 sp110 nuclear body protein isoform X1 [Pteropus giganteus]
MFTMTPALENALLQQFMYQKLEISYAIRKPFPFFEGLRDKSFITERMYRESLEACRNLVPVYRVVYNILTQLEDTFSLSFLQLLFSQINLREYPDLKTILNSFLSVVNSYGGRSKATLTLPEAPANSLERSSCQTLLSLPPPQHPPSRHLTPGPRISTPGASPQHVVEVLGEPSSPAGPARALLTVTQKKRITPVTNLTTHTNDEADSQQMPSTPSTTMQMIRNYSPEPNNAKELQEASSTAPNKKGKKRKRYSWSTPRKRHKKKSVPRGTASPGYGIQETLQEVNQVTQRKNSSTRNVEVVTRAQKAREEWAQTSGLEEVSDDASETNEGKTSQEPPSTPPRIVQDSLDRGSKVSIGKSSGEKQKKRKKNSRSSSKRRQKKSLPKGTASPEHRIQEKLQVADQATQRKDNSTTSSQMVTRAQKAKTKCAQTSGLEEKEREIDVCSSSTRSCQKNTPQKKKNEDETVDFHSPELPVTCGEAKGILYKEMMGKGTSVKCIENEEGVWLTLREFEIEGKKAHSKNWKQSVRCGGMPLAQLIEKGLLFCPPRISLKREKTSSNCEVCCRGGPLLCCDTCPRAFHKNCHIPSAEAERSPWSCTFCRMKASSRSRQHRRKSVALARRMSPEEQLKCEFLLLKAYCHPQGSFFVETPRNMKDYAEPFKEAMWLDLMKERLAEKEYTMAWFVRDMRLIFLNHKNFYKASNLSQVGLDLEANFEKDLNELLIFNEANENSFQSLP